MELEFVERDIGLNLKFARGDQFPVKFKVKNASEEYLDTNTITEVIVTCRKYPDLESEMLFQKKLTNGFVEYKEDYFEFFILEEDTNKLDYGTYGYDIKIVTESETRTFVGHIEVADEYTIGVIKKNFYLVDLEVTPTSEEQVFEHEESMGYDIVTVKGADASVDPNIIPSNIKKDVEILGVVGDLEGGMEAEVVGTTLVLSGGSTVSGEELIING